MAGEVDLDSITTAADKFGKKNYWKLRNNESFQNQNMFSPPIPECNGSRIVQLQATSDQKSEEHTPSSKTYIVTQIVAVAIATTSAFHSTE